jgi:hypothetical protein
MDMDMDMNNVDMDVDFHCVADSNNRSESVSDEMKIELQPGSDNNVSNKEEEIDADSHQQNTENETNPHNTSSASASASPTSTSTSTVTSVDTPHMEYCFCGRSLRQSQWGKHNSSVVYSNFNLKTFKAKKQRLTNTATKKNKNRSQSKSKNKHKNESTNIHTLSALEFECECYLKLFDGAFNLGIFVSVAQYISDGELDCILQFLSRTCDFLYFDVVTAEEYSVMKTGSKWRDKYAIVRPKAFYLTLITKYWRIIGNCLLESKFFYHQSNVPNSLFLVE